MSISKAITNLYAEYGRYIDSARMIPHKHDCLKPVEKRILYVVSKIAKANSKSVKSSKIVGEVMGGYHPHGDQSIYDTMVKMVNDGKIVGQGNFGSPGFVKDSSAAAYRYTEVKSNKDLIKIYNEYIKFVPYVQSEADEQEPKYFSGPVPIGLIGDGVITGIGFHTTKIPNYTFQDLLKRLVYLIKKEDNNGEEDETNNPPPIIKPNVRGCNVVEDSPGEFEKILKTGEGKIWINPHYKVSGNKLILSGRNPLFKFTKLKNFNEKYINTNGQDFFEYYDDSGTKNHDVYVEIYPYRNKKISQDFLNKIYSLVKTSAIIKCNVVEDDDTVKLMSIDELLINSYYNWATAWKHKLRNDKSLLEEKLKEIEIVKVVREIIEKQPSIKKTQEILDYFQNNYDTTKYSFGVSSMEEVINKYTIKKLVEYSTDKTRYNNELIEIKKQLKSLKQSTVDKINSYISSGEKVVL